MKIYIQIGANVGGDEFQTIITNLLEPSRVFLVEPNTSLTESLAKSYYELGSKHQIIILPYAVSLHNGTEDFYECPLSPHSSLIKRRSNQAEGIVVKNVNVLTFNELCQRYNIVDIECLYIDTEGMDYEILNSIELSKVNIRTIYFEQWDHREDDLNWKYRTGPGFLKDVIIPKFKNYNWENVPDSQNIKLTKKT